ncbi:MAG: ATP-binding protein [Planctomycetota bacterium]
MTHSENNRDAHEPSSQIAQATGFRFRNRYVIALGLLALLMVSNQTIIQNTIQSQSTDAAIINVAGRQRMLSQKIAKLGLEVNAGLNEGLDEKRQKLKDTLSLIENNHLKIQSARGAEPPSRFYAQSSSIRNQFKELEPHFDQLVESGKRIANKNVNSQELESSLKSLLDSEKEFLPRMNAIVNSLQREAEQRVHFLKKMEWILLSIMLTVLLFESFLIFEPAIRTIDRQFQSLKHQLLINSEKAKELSNLATQLENRSNVLDKILYSVNEGIIAVDDKGGVLCFNRCAEELFGEYEDVKCSDNSWSEYLGFRNPGNKKLVVSDQCAFNEAIDGRAVLDREFFLQQSDDEKYIQVNASPMQIDQKPAAVILCRDISKEKQSQQLSEHLNLERQKSARQAGMAEVAVEMLHNVGNVLNSVNVSISIVRDKLQNRPTELICRIADSIPEDVAELGPFFESDKGKLLPTILKKYSKTASQFNEQLLNEILSLNQSVEEVNRILAAQQSLSEIESSHERVDVNELINETKDFCVNRWRGVPIRFAMLLGEVPNITGKLFDISEILKNVIQNAMEASASKLSNDDHCVAIKTYSDEQSVFIEITDNGNGIRKEDLTRIFQLGYSTKPSRAGISLHTSANSAQKMGGNLEATSPGIGQGATFSLVMPLQTAGQKTMDCQLQTSCPLN